MKNLIYTLLFVYLMAFFSPYTGIKTNILFLKKVLLLKHVWYFEHPYPEGYKSYSRGKPLRIEEFFLEKKWWNKSQAE